LKKAVPTGAAFFSTFEPMIPKPSFSPWTGLPQALTVLALCLLARLLTTIHHIEDADSLRFALAMIDFDVTKLQPQFPGYPVFCFFARLLYALSGSYATAFSILGGAGLFVIVHYSLALLKWRFSETRGFLLAVVLAFNPMLWLLGNRYMTDLSGAACALAAFYHLTREQSRRHAAAGFFLAGIQAGWRLSYLPVLLIPMAANLLHRPWKTERALEKILAGAAGILVWMIPFIAVTGWNNLIASSRRQTAGHFLETGGTYVSEPGWTLRAVRLLRDMWVDGLGAWEPGRNPLTAIVAAGAVLFIVRGALSLRGKKPESDLRLLALSCALYAAWIFVFQNVVNQPRHVLPLVPPMLMLLAGGLPATVNIRKPVTFLAAVFLAAYGMVGATLALQHKRPAAIAQVRNLMAKEPDSSFVLVGAPWVVKCLSTQGIRQNFRIVETPEELRALKDLDSAERVVTVGNYVDYIDRPVSSKKTFYHNPYVNRLGSTVEVFWYGPAR
jgi:4-amino-4-deoxy-L-arabinose transferase-like glycosyltransferase